MRTRTRVTNDAYPARIRWLARLALLTLLLQLSSLGHWSVGPFHPGADTFSTHTAHCHGDTSACGGQPSFVGTYIERPLTVSIPTATFELGSESQPLPQTVALPTPDEPPRAL